MNSRLGIYTFRGSSSFKEPHLLLVFERLPLLIGAEVDVSAHIHDSDSGKALVEEGFDVGPFLIEVVHHCPLLTRYFVQQSAQSFTFPPSLVGTALTYITLRQKLQVRTSRKFPTTSPSSGRSSLILLQIPSSLGRTEILSTA